MTTPSELGEERDPKIEQLGEIADRDKGIKAEVTKEALSREFAIAFLEDILQYGCASGAYSTLIYYEQTHAFFERHYDEIEELRQRWEEERGQPLQIDGDLKNFLAWFGVEYRVGEILAKIENEA